MVLRVLNVFTSRHLIVKSAVFPLCGICRYPHNLVVYFITPRKCVIPIVCVKLGKLYVVKHSCVVFDYIQFPKFQYSILDTIDHIGEETMESCGRCIWTALADCLGSNPHTIGVSIQCQLFCSITTEDPYFGKLGLYTNLSYAFLKTVYTKSVTSHLYIDI